MCSSFLKKIVLTTAALTMAAFPAFADDISFAETNSAVGDHVVLYVNNDLNLPLQIGGEMTIAIQKAMEASGFKGTFGNQKSFYGLGDTKSVTVIGTGSDRLTPRNLRDLGGHTVKAPGDGDLSVIVEGLKTQSDTSSADLAFGYRLGDYSFTKYKTGNLPEDRSVTFISEDADEAQDLMEGDYEGLADAVHMVRDLGNAPGLEIYPETFVERIRKEARGVPNLKLTVMGVREMERAGMGAILGVGKGSVHDPRMLVLEYMGGDSNDAPLALVGKGITFDTGGISLKPNSGQWLMKSDLSGAAAVAGTLISTAKRGADINLIGVMPLAENMPDGTAIRPGDVLTTFNGKTIEVMSTDAEGRLLLVDAVPYTIEKYQPELIVDIATLTGSVGRALSDEYGGVITRDFDLAQTMMDIGERSGEDVWPLPLHPNHYDQIKSDIADIKSTAGSPGASIGAAVIGTFVDEDQPWVHIDMAGVDWRDSATPTAPKGHAGWGVRFMDQLVRDYEKK
ncbi:MAG: leucyl aminopeptidase [Litorimonas sp.]